MRSPHNDRLNADSARHGLGLALAPDGAGVPEVDRVDGAGDDARDAAAGEFGHSPERCCVLTARRGPRAALIRLAFAPPAANGEVMVLPDVLARAPGRGAWIGVTRDELAAALAKGKLARTLARAYAKSASAKDDRGESDKPKSDKPSGAKPGAAHRLVIPADLPERIVAALTRALADRLGLETRAGRLLTGSDRIAEAARKGRIAWLAHAADASLDGCRKLDAALRVGSDTQGSGRCGVRLPLDREALSVALGRDNVVHLALDDPAAASRVAGLAMRLRDFLGHDSLGHDSLGDDPAGDTDDRLDVAGEDQGLGDHSLGQTALTPADDTLADDDAMVADIISDDDNHQPHATPVRGITRHLRTAIPQ